MRRSRAKLPCNKLNSTVPIRFTCSEGSLLAKTVQTGHFLSIGILLALPTDGMSTINQYRYAKKLCGKQILIVEEHTKMTNSMAEFLKNYDYTLAGSVKEAVEAIDRQRPDIILLDVSCLDVARTVREKETTESVLIIGMSAKPTERSECLAAGCSVFILRPFGMRKFLDRLGNVL